MADNMALVLQLLLDESAKAKTLKGIKEVKDAVTKFDDTGGGVPESTIDLTGKTIKERTKIVNDLMKEINAEIARKNLSPDEKDIQFWKEQAQWMGVSVEEAKEANRLANIANKEREKAVILEREAKVEAGVGKHSYRGEPDDPSIKKMKEAREAAAKSVLEQEKKITAEYAKQMREVTRLNRTASIVGRIGQSLSVGGLATVGGMFALGNKEAQRQKEIGQITAETKKWLEAQLRIEKATERIGRVAETTILPYLEKAAALAERASKYLEAHPELAKALLSAGTIAIGLGSILTLASKGIRMYADIKYEALQLANMKALEANTAALVGGSLGKYGVKGGAIGPAEAVAGGLTTAAITTVATVVAGVLAGMGIVDKINKKGIEAGTSDTSLTTIKKAMVVWGQLMPERMEKLGLISTQTRADIFELQKNILGLGDASKDTQQALDDLAAASEEEAKGMKILADLAEAEAKAERQYADDRESILMDASRALGDSNRRLDRDMQEIAKNLVENISKIRADLAKTLADLASNFTDENIKAAKEYQEQRTKIETDGVDEIRKIREQAQKDLEQLEKDHNQNVYALTLDRDALGLSMENKAYADKQSEIRNNADEAVDQARANTKAQLEEAARNYEDQRVQRLAEYNKQKEEAQQRAQEAIVEAQKNAEDAKKQAAQDYKERKDEIARRQAEALADLKRQFDAEQRERVLAARNSIRELGNDLQAEVMLRRKYYTIIQTELNLHLDALAKSFAGIRIPGGGPIPQREAGGYTSSGLYNMHSGEFVANRSTTRALENMIGGRLTQANILRAGSGGVVIQQTLRFSGEIGVSDKREIQKIAKESAISGVLAAIGA